MQGAAALIIHCIQVGASCCQHLNHAHVAKFGSQVQRPLGVLEMGLQRCTRCNQLPRSRCLPMPGSIGEGCPACHRIACLQIGASCQQLLYHLRVAALSRHMQSSVAAVLCSI